MDQFNFNPSQKPKRRQNRSCDQCRAGKRACDVQIGFECGSVNSLESGCLSAFPSARNQRAFLTRWPCSNCTKWRKSCTVDWIISQRTNSYPEPTVKRRKHDIANGPSADRCLPSVRTSRSFDQCHADTFFLSGTSIYRNNDRTSDWPDVDRISKQPISTAEKVDINSLAETRGFTPPYWPDALLGDGTKEGEDQEDALRFSDQSLLPSPPLTFDSSQEAIDGYEDEQLGVLQNEMSQTSSPTLAYLLGEANQRISIKKNLLKIYHDAMEGALSCWLTERNCPYVYSRFDSRTVWSSDWSNRIVGRVCSLERFGSSKLSRCNSSDQQATKVLNLAIMAFAAQWAQMGERSDQRLPASFDGVDGWKTTGQDHFDRSMQKALWHQASCALLKASDNPSYKVVFALIIFSLTQKPQDTTEGQAQHTSMQDVLQSDGPPVFLELALRQLHSNRREMISATRSKSSKVLEKAEKETFDLLFWLAVMFDTLSAAMHQRSFVVTDDDTGVDSEDRKEQLKKNIMHCDLDGWDDSSESSNSQPEDEVKLWGDYFLRDQNRTGDSRKASTRWPCSYEDAASSLCDAAPVKVLLYRRVGQLQALQCQPSHPTSALFDTAIDAALEVYNHWNRTYGLFITDCIDHHEGLPARIQSWYILLAGHWHLAVFILADTIDEIDQASLGSLACQESRKLAGLTARLRSDSAFAVSELGRCSRYSDEDLSFSKSKDFHFAVNKAALLTEPWTAVLVRSFGRAGEILAAQLQHDYCSNVTQQLQYCIDALWLLGKKSDMALQAARVLVRSMADG